MDGQGEVFLIPGAVVFGDEYAGAQGDALEQADHHKDEVGRGADGGQSLLADELPDDEGVGGVVELLEKIPNENGDGKGHESPPDGTLQHGGRILPPEEADRHEDAPQIQNKRRFPVKSSA